LAISKKALVQYPPVLDKTIDGKKVVSWTIETKDPSGKTSIAPHPNSRHFATLSEDGSVRIWDTTYPKVPLRSILVGHDAGPLAEYTNYEMPNGIEWDQSGKLLATCDRTGLLIVWEIQIELDEQGTVSLAREKYRIAKQEKGIRHRIRNFNWSPEGTHLAVAFLDQKGTVSVFDGETGKEVAKPYSNEMLVKSFRSENVRVNQSSPFSLEWYQADSQLLLAFTYRDSDRIYVWDVLNRDQPTPTNLGLQSVIGYDFLRYRPLAWSANGKYLATRIARNESGVMVWETEVLLENSTTTPKKPTYFHAVDRPRSIVWAPSSSIAILTDLDDTAIPKNQIEFWTPGDVESDFGGVSSRQRVRRLFSRG